MPRETNAGFNNHFFVEGTTTVDTSANTVTFAEPHGYDNLDAVIYVCDEGTNTAIGGLVPFQMYYVRVIDANTVAFHYYASNSETRRRSITANGVSGGVTRSALIQCYMHYAYYSNDYGYMYVERNPFNANTYNELGYVPANNPVFYIRSNAEGYNTTFNVVSNPWQINESTRSTYDYYIRTYSTSSYYYYSYYSTTNRVFTSFNSFTDMGMVPTNFAANSSSLWVPNHGIEAGTKQVVTITATTGTLPTGLSSGQSYVAERVDDNRLTFENTNGTNVSFTSAGSANLVYRVQGTITKSDANTIDIAANTLNEGECCNLLQCNSAR